MKYPEISEEALEKYKEFRTKHNKFGHLMGYRIAEMKVGYARVELPVREEFYNPVGSVHGGVIFSLADTTSGTCAASYGIKMTTLDATIQFLAPVMDQKLLIGEGREIKHGQTVSVIEVRIKDENEKLIASGTFTFYSLGVPLLGSELADEFPDADEKVLEERVTDHGSPLPLKEGMFDDKKGTAC